MTSFSLDTRTPEHKAAAKRIAKELKETFGEENVKVSKNWDCWVLIEVAGTLAYFNGVCASVEPNTLSISDETKKRYLISGDLIDTVYIL